MSGYISPVTPLSPEDSIEDHSSNRLLQRAVHVLRVEAEALANVANLYETDATAQDGLSSAVKAVLKSQNRGGKLVICGVGKSGYIGMKMTATCKSMGISASFMHACEAAHGDLGDIRSKDVLLFISFSGKTPELMNLLPHVDASVQMMAMTSHRRRKDCQLLVDRENGILLPTPIHEKEEVSFGVTAPTTSTTVALAVADMIALNVADELHSGKTKDVFLKNHPGGAIGMTHQEVQQLKRPCEDVSIVELPSPSISAESDD